MRSDDSFEVLSGLLSSTAKKLEEGPSPPHDNSSETKSLHDSKDTESTVPKNDDEDLVRAQYFND